MGEGVQFLTKVTAGRKFDGDTDGVLMECHINHILSAILDKNGHGHGVFTLEPFVADFAGW
jgi:hypothetical protein